MSRSPPWPPEPHRFTQRPSRASVTPPFSPHGLNNTLLSGGCVHANTSGCGNQRGAEHNLQGHGSGAESLRPRARAVHRRWGQTAMMCGRGGGAEAGVGSLRTESLGCGGRERAGCLVSRWGSWAFAGPRFFPHVRQPERRTALPARKTASRGARCGLAACSARRSRLRAGLCWRLVVTRGRLQAALPRARRGLRGAVLASRRSFWEILLLCRFDNLYPKEVWTRP